MARPHEMTRLPFQMITGSFELNVDAGAYTTHPNFLFSYDRPIVLKQKLPAQTVPVGRVVEVIHVLFQEFGKRLVEHVMSRLPPPEYDRLPLANAHRYGFLVRAHNYIEGPSGDPDMPWEVEGHFYLECLRWPGRSDPEFVAESALQDYQMMFDAEEEPDPALVVEEDDPNCPF